MTRTIRINRFDEAPEWAQNLDGTEATAEQIAASDEAVQGLITIDEDGNVAAVGVMIWVD